MKKPLVQLGQARKLIRAHGSPLYVYSKKVVATRYKDLVRSIPYRNKKIYYACKANTNADILRLLKQLGSSVECVSRGEVERALRVGFSPDHISYTCSNIHKEELRWVMKKGVSVQVDSLTQLEWWGEMKPGSDVSLRVNRGFGAGATLHVITGGPESKFGIYYTDLGKAQAIAKKYRLRIVGLAQHIGSSIMTPDTFVQAMKLLFESAADFPALNYLDFGGGIGIPYKPDQRSIDIPSLGKKVARVLEEFCVKYGRPLELRLQPGRYIVAESGALLTQVVDIKHSPTHTFVGIDSGFNHLIRPAFYGSYHHIFNLSNPQGTSEVVHVVGNMCESSDVFASERNIPKARVGDVLLLADAGAYGYTMSSDYNLRPKPKEVLIG